MNVIKDKYISSPDYSEIPQVIKNKSINRNKVTELLQQLQENLQDSGEDILLDLLSVKNKINKDHC